VRTKFCEKNLCANGAYDLVPAEGAQVTIFATGSEIEIALKGREALEAKGISTRVVSVPCVELFLEQSEDYQKSIIGNSPVKVAVEAGIRQGWDHFIGSDGIFIGMHSFGASGPYKELYKHFGITPEAIVSAVEEKLA
jgi:transketolase